MERQSAGAPACCGGTQCKRRRDGVLQGACDGREHMRGVLRRSQAKQAFVFTRSTASPNRVEQRGLPLTMGQWTSTQWHEHCLCAGEHAQRAHLSHTDWVLSRRGRCGASLSWMYESYSMTSHSTALVLRTSAGRFPSCSACHLPLFRAATPPTLQLLGSLNCCSL